MPFRLPAWIACCLLGFAGSLLAQEEESSSGPRHWSITISAGPVFGGPSAAMTQRFLEENWTEPGCTTKGTDCHPNPARRRPLLQGSALLSRQFGRRLELQLAAAGGGLGHVEGRRDGYVVVPSWSVLSLGSLLAFKPFEAYRVGAGPLLAVLDGETPEGTPTTVLRPGLVFETGLRSSAEKQLFLSASMSYRLIAKRLEGPWPARKATFYGIGGPSPLELDYSHLSINLGLGARF